MNGPKISQNVIAYGGHNKLHFLDLDNEKWIINK